MKCGTDCLTNLAQQARALKKELTDYRYGWMMLPIVNWRVKTRTYDDLAYCFRQSDRSLQCERLRY